MSCGRKRACVRLRRRHQWMRPPGILRTIHAAAADARSHHHRRLSRVWSRRRLQLDSWKIYRQLASRRLRAYRLFGDAERAVGRQDRARSPSRNARRVFRRRYDRRPRRLRSSSARFVRGRCVRRSANRAALIWSRRWLHRRHCARRVRPALARVGRSRLSISFCGGIGQTHVLSIFRTPVIRIARLVVRAPMQVYPYDGIAAFERCRNRCRDR